MSCNWVLYFFDTVFLTVLELLFYVSYSFYSHVVFLQILKDYFPTKTLFIFVCFNASWNFYLNVKYGRREEKKCQAAEDYNCLQEHMVVRPGQQSSGGFYSHQILRVELHPYNSEHGWLFSLSNIWASIHIVVKILGASACMGSATWFPNGILLLFCLTSLSITTCPCSIPTSPP